MIDAFLRADCLQRGELGYGPNGEILAVGDLLQEMKINDTILDLITFSVRSRVKKPCYREDAKALSQGFSSQ